MLSKKVALQNKSPYFGSKQPVLLPAVAKTSPEMNKLWSKVFMLSKTVIITALTKAATYPRKDDQLAETQVKVLEANICQQEKSSLKQITIFCIEETCFAACSCKDTTKTEQALV